MNTRTKIGILSAAHMHAHSYAVCLNENLDAELAGLWDDDPERGQAVAQQFGTSFFPELDAILDSDIDAVIVCAENVKHRALVEAAASAGKWILCEKPLATTTEDAKAMIAVCEKAGVGLGTAFPCRFAPTLYEVKSRVVQGELGEILAASCTNNGQFPGGWFADPKLSGGGAVMDHTVHVVDLLRWITQKEFTRVYCTHANRFHPEIDTDDIGSLHLEMEGGIIVSHVASWNRPRSFPTWGDVTIELIGTEGTLKVDAFHQKIDVFSDQANRAQWVGWGDNADLELIRDFVDAVADKRDPEATGLDGLRAVEVTVAAYRSAETGAMVDV
ncbi:MAG: Gfo/Idh/MocA family oxidoreductase [Candidatus Hydrogenedentes bacterium]|nr:Gfo/Idh/MocA family oxidoreductase [Candidatus Hydrogenedentota bacterium]